MKAHWWNCVLGLLCMPANVMLSTWTASSCFYSLSKVSESIGGQMKTGGREKGVDMQHRAGGGVLNLGRCSKNQTLVQYNWVHGRQVSQDPSSISLMRVNSSAKITCSTSLPDPLGLYLQSGFHDIRDIVYLSLENGLVTKNTTDPEFVGRINVAPDQQIREGYGFTLQLSLLGQEDTNVYHCSWKYFKLETANIETLPSVGTVIIVKESDPHEQCRDHIWDLILIAFSVTAFIVLLFLFVRGLVRRKRFKKNFRPARAGKPPRVNRPQRVCPHQGGQHCPYLVTSVNSPPLDFRGIL